MLKVKNEKGKFDIVLNEEKLFDAKATGRGLKGRTKGFSSKSSQSRTSHATTSKNQATNVPKVKRIEKAKGEVKGQLRDDATRHKTANTTKELAVNDASYLTKDQLSRILSSLTSESRGPPAGLEDSKKSEAKDTSVNQFSTANSQRSRDLMHVPEGQTSAGVTAIPKQSKENEFQEYNPWGRPGGGAPIRTQSGIVVADFKKMAKNEAKASSGETNDFQPRMMATVEASSSHYVKAETPSAMRSSFAVGAPGVVQYETDQSKAERKKKWLQELEQQIKAKQEREAQEKLHQLLKDAKQDSWHQRPVPHESSASVTVSSSTAIDSPLTTEASVAPGGSVRAVNVHARGHGLQSLGQVNQNELERKRMKTLEHQLAIKEQVEEKRRLKQEEKERRMKEEAEKERALAQERARLQIQYEEELKLRQEKEEEARRRAEALQQSVSQAYESAQQEKALKRLKHLESGGHNVTGLKSRLENTSPREHKAGFGSVHQDKAQSTEIHTDSSSHATQYPQSSPRVGKGSELLMGSEDRSIYSTHLKNESFEAELKEISLNTSLESQWIPSSPVSNPRNDSQAKSALSESSPSPRKDKAQKYKTARSQSERSQRKKQPPKQLRNKRPSLENVTQGEDINPPPPPPPPVPRDAFLLPYRRTSSATFPAATADTPSSHQDTFGNTSKLTIKKTQSDQTAEYRQVKESTKKPTNMRKDNETRKVSEIPRVGQGLSSKTSAVSRMAEKRKGKHVDDGKPLLQPVQVSPDPLPTARQEMILQQLAALRQGLMMKERELHYGAL